MAAHKLSHHQLHQLEIIERVASCFSVIGTSFVIITFVSSSAFRKPINRLIFYASIGNVVCNIATLMAQTGIRAGRDSHLCQFQAFLIQMFLPADALWNLAMAINVYLTIFRKFTGERLKKLEWIYLLVCYGVTFIVALVGLFISSPSRGKMYGPNVLWCSIPIEWAFMRIVVVYGPAWICIAVSLFLYTISGIELLKKRAQLVKFRSPKSGSQLDSISAENLVTDSKTIRIQIVSEPAAVTPPGENLHDTMAIAKNGLQVITSPAVPENNLPNFITTIKSSNSDSRPHSGVTMVSQSQQRAQRRKKQRANADFNRAALGYTKVALLFFFCMLITWVPASVNRFYSFLHPHKVHVPSSYITSVVLPLMGFWNSVIYIVTSWRAVQGLFTGKLGKIVPWEGRTSRTDVESGSRKGSTITIVASNNQEQQPREFKNFVRDIWK